MSERSENLRRLDKATLDGKPKITNVDNNSTEGVSEEKKLPNYKNSQIADPKIGDYLLSLKNQAGKGKAIFFMKHGFSPEEGHILKDALLRHTAENPVKK